MLHLCLRMLIQKIILILLIGILLCTAAQAQHFSVSGKIEDSKKAPVSFANILLMAKDSIVTQGITKTDGSFALSTPQGNYIFLVKQLNDTLYMQHLELNKNIDFGILQIKTSGELQTVTV